MLLHGNCKVMLNEEPQWPDFNKLKHENLLLKHKNMLLKGHKLFIHLLEPFFPLQTRDTIPFRGEDLIKRRERGLFTDLCERTRAA